MISYFGLLWLAITTQAQINLPFDTIYSVHSSDVPRCPPGYQADSKYIACCSTYDYLTTALAPGSTAVPACCNSDAVGGCTGAAEVMLEWKMSTDTILDKTTIVPITPGSQGATTAAAKPTPTGSVPTATTTNGGDTNNNGNTNVNNNSIKIGSAPGSSYWNMGVLCVVVFLRTLYICLLGF